MNIAVFGDLHGNWGDFCRIARELNQKVKLDAILQCGDAQPIRSDEDLAFVSTPAKYRNPGDFVKVLDGSITIPVQMLFIGGNHEPYNFLDQHMEGGFIAGRLYYLGRAGFRMLDERISVSGLSGVYSPKYFEKPRLLWPYNESKRKQATYFNEAEVRSMSGHPLMHILLLHEWPDIMNAARDATWPAHWDRVGIQPLSAIINAKAPRWTFCGHMHKRAYYNHEGCHIVCLGDFSTDPRNSCGVLNTDNNEFVWLEDVL